MTLTDKERNGIAGTLLIKIAEKSNIGDFIHRLPLYMAEAGVEDDSDSQETVRMLKAYISTSLFGIEAVEISSKNQLTTEGLNEILWKVLCVYFYNNDEIIKIGKSIDILINDLNDTIHGTIVRGVRRDRTKEFFKLLINEILRKTFK